MTKHMETMNVIEVNVDSLKTHKLQPERRTTDKAMQKLITSIEESHFVAPIAINEQYEIIDGHRRVAAVRALGQSTVPAYVVKNVSFSRLNSGVRKMSSAEWLTVWAKATSDRERRSVMLHMPAWPSKCIRDLIDTLSRAEVKKLGLRGDVNPAVIRYITILTAMMRDCGIRYNRQDVARYVIDYGHINEIREWNKRPVSYQTARLKTLTKKIDEAKKLSNKAPSSEKVKAS